MKAMQMLLSEEEKIRAVLFLKLNRFLRVQLQSKDLHIFD